MLFLVFILLAMLLLQNTLFYSLSLLTFACLSIYILVAGGMLQPLTGIMLLLVYLGAVIILIGYICAVSPNFITHKRVNWALCLAAFLALCALPTPLLIVTSNFSSPLPFFFSPAGLGVFVLIACMLFVTLLIVTSNFSSPQGPFRSV